MRVTQILWNLLKNAIKFTPKGGVVTVRSGIASEEGADWLTIEVQDTGLGIEPSQAYQIFRPFAQGGRKITRQYGGLGLGLSISSGIAQAHGGAITVASGGVGRGSTFTLTLPCSAPDESRPSAKAAPLRVPWTAGPARAAERKAEHPLRVLLVEDHADTAAVMARLLGRMGYDVVCAATASEAIQVAGKEVKEAGIDLVVSDVGLPDGSGLDMMKQLSTAYGLRGIAISGNGGERDIAKSVAAGFGRHLVKPVDVATLRQAIAAMVKGT
jgi:CheY-like chemotaxis protein